MGTHQQAERDSVFPSHKVVEACCCIHTCLRWYARILFCVQLLKLAVLQALPELSELYVIWDMDMIPARHIPLVYLPSSEISSIGASDALQLPMSTSVMSMHSQPVRTVVNIGGAWSPGYGQSYEKLLHKKCGARFTHHVRTTRPWLSLQYLCERPIAIILSVNLNIVFV